MDETRDWNSPEYKRWRNAVFKRDRFRCQFPGCRRRSRLQAHHIRRWADCPELRFSVENGVCLCRQHHDRVQGHEDEFAPVFLRIVGAGDIMIKLLLMRHADKEGGSP